MKVNKKNLSLYLAIGVLLLTFSGGFYLYNSQPAVERRSLNLQKKEQESQNENQSQDKQNNEEETDQQNQGNGNGGSETEQTAQVKPDLKDVGLEASIADAGNIVLKLYGPAGEYKVEHCLVLDGKGECTVTANWSIVKDKIALATSQKFDLGEKIPISQTQRRYRIYLIEKGQITGSKEILIDRNLVDRQGTTNFPGAL